MVRHLQAIYHIACPYKTLTQYKLAFDDECPDLNESDLKRAAYLIFSLWSE